MKSSNIGGQAVLEGIMMKNGPKYAVAVRKPDGEIEVKVEEYKSEYIDIKDIKILAKTKQIKFISKNSIKKYISNLKEENQ